MKLVGRVARSEVDAAGFVRMAYAPYDVLVAMIGDEPVAIEDACNHAGASLSEGEREGDCVSCPMHGYIFELRTGRLVAPKGLCDDQRAFRATLEAGVITVWDPAQVLLIR